MRVISGSARGRRLVAPEGTDVRPTSDRVRGALFNMLVPLLDLDGAAVVDLCCGTGALGIEALSRGAAAVHFVDVDRRSLAATAANLVGTGFGALSPATEPAVHVVHAEAVAWAQAGGSDLDLVLADPPYAFDRWDAVLSGLSRRCDLVVAESDREVVPPVGWDVGRVRAHGGTVVTVLVAAAPRP